MLSQLRNAGKAKGRPQDQNTPKWLIRLEEKSIGGGPFDMDPASNRRSLVGARLELYKRDDGLRMPWRERGRKLGVDVRTVHCNPPWEEMDVWMPRFEQEAKTGLALRVVVPLRPHRTYWVWPEAVCFLPPVAFEGCGGYGFPGPVICGAWGRIDLFVSTFESAFPGSTFRVSRGRLAGFSRRQRLTRSR